MLCENVQNKLCAVDDLALRDIGQVVKLGGRKLPIENEGIGIAHESRNLELGHFAAAEYELRVDLAHALNHAPADRNAGRAAEFRKLIQVPFLYGSGFGRHGDDHGACPGLRLTCAVLAAEFLFQGQSRSHEIRFRLIPGLRSIKHVGLRCLRGHEMSSLPLYRVAEWIHGQGDHAVEAQEEHIHEIFLAEQIGREVRVQEAQTAQPRGAGTGMWQFGDVDAVRFAHDDHVHTPAAVYEQANLTAQRPREQGDFSRLLYGIHFMFRELALGQPVKGFELAGFQSLQISVNVRNSSAP